MNDEIIMLDMSDPDFEQQLKDAIGLLPRERGQVITPQFERTDGRQAFIPVDTWPMLTRLSADTLKSLGCGTWDEPDENGKVLMLFPYQWYPHIPAGFEIEDINGETERFEPGKTDDDRRFGCLAYGVRV